MKDVLYYLLCIYEKYKLPLDSNLKGDFNIDSLFGNIKREDLHTLLGVVLEIKSIRIQELEFKHDTDISKFFNYCIKNGIFDINPGCHFISNFIIDNDYRLSIKYQRELKLSKILN